MRARVIAFSQLPDMILSLQCSNPAPDLGFEDRQRQGTAAQHLIVESADIEASAERGPRFELIGSAYAATQAFDMPLRMVIEDEGGAAVARFTPE